LPKKTEAFIEPEILRWAMDLADVMEDELATRLKLKQADEVRSWLEGSSRPSFAKLRKFQKY
jgi:hypothetical protein